MRSSALSVPKKRKKRIITTIMSTIMSMSTNMKATITMNMIMTTIRSTAMTRTVPATIITTMERAKPKSTAYRPSSITAVRPSTCINSTVSSLRNGLRTSSAQKEWFISNTTPTCRSFSNRPDARKN